MLEVLLGNTVVAAGLAGVVLVISRLFQLSPAARHALWLVVVVKLLSPIGFIWSVALPVESFQFLDKPMPVTAQIQTPVGPPARAATLFVETLPEPALFGELDVADPGAYPAIYAEDARWGAETSAATAFVTPPESHEGLAYLWLLLLWLAGALAVIARYVRRTVRFAKYARSGRPASPSLQRQVNELAAILGVRAPQARILADLPSPVVWCLFRPVLLWPRGLQDQLSCGGRRAVLIHELAHLRRRDHWVRWLELLAAVVHWWNPLFWLVRRQIRFHAELACDAWVTGTLPEIRRDYAEALLEVCARSSRAAAPSPAVGVGGDGRRDFQRRLTMIMREQVPCRLAAGAKLFVVLLLTAAIPAWTLGQAKPESKPGNTPLPKVEIKEIEFGDILGQVGVATFQNQPADPEAVKKAKEIEAKIADLQRQIELLKAAKPAPQPGWRVVNPAPAAPATPAPGIPQPFKVIGPDGQEIKGARVIMVAPEPNPGPMQKKEATLKLEDARKRLQGLFKQVEIQPGEVKAPEIRARFTAPNVLWAVVEGREDNTINLKRTTYKLPKEKAAALAAFLKDNVKAPVLEIKADDAGVTVTTTPEVQSVVGSIAKLMTGGQGFKIEFQMRDIKIEPGPTPKK